MKRTALVFFSLTLLFTASAKNYYVSGDGDDTHSGESPEQAWKSLDKVNAAMALFQAGDSVLLRRGDIFNGSLYITSNGSANAPVVFSGYGEGSKPVIDGSVSVQEWTAGVNGIWSADLPEIVTGEVKNLFIDGKVAPLGRHPNGGFYYTSNPEGKTIFSCPDMADFAENYWDGADIAIRTANWIFDVLPVESVTGERVVLKEDATYDLRSGYGFFIQNHVHALDEEGEWAWTDDGKVFLFAEQFDPNDRDIAIPVYGEGIYIDDADYIEIKELVIANQKERGVVIEYSEYVGLYESEILFSGVDALHGNWVNDLDARNNIFRGANNNGLVLKNSNNSTLIRNEVSRIGTVAGRGLNGNLKYNGIQTDGCTDILIQHNQVDSIGYNGINFFRSAGIKIRDNSISYACLVKDDGGGIYTWESQRSGNEITGNIVTYTMGEQTGVPPGVKQHKAFGIYIDDRSWDLLLADNTVAYSHDYGIYIHNARDVIIENNILVDNDIQLGFAGGDDWPGNVVSGNTFVCTDDNMLCVRIYTNYNYPENFPAFNNNVYGKFTPYKIAYQKYDNISTYSNFEQWSEVTGEEDMRGWPVPYNDSINREDFLFFAYNAKAKEVTVPLEQSYRDMENNTVEGSISLPPFSSVVLVLETGQEWETTFSNRFSGGEVDLYPNPSSGPVTLRFGELDIAKSLQVYNSKGILLARQNILPETNRKYRLDMSPFGSGIYFIQISMEDRVVTKKLMMNY